jgi:hypothetical protein
MTTLEVLYIIRDLLDTLRFNARLADSYYPLSNLQEQVLALIKKYEKQL